MTVLRAANLGFALVLYAEALMDEHPWDDWRDDGEPQPWTPEIVAVIERVLEQAPEHPMANHLYIHAVEANARAAAVDERYVSQCHAAGLYPLGYHPHNYHFLWATTTLEGRSKDAEAAGDKVREMVDPDMMRKPGLRRAAALGANPRGATWARCCCVPIVRARPKRSTGQTWRSFPKTAGRSTGWRGRSRRRASLSRQPTRAGASTRRGSTPTCS